MFLADHLSRAPQHEVAMPEKSFQVFSLELESKPYSSPEGNSRDIGAVTAVYWTGRSIARPQFWLVGQCKKSKYPSISKNSGHIGKSYSTR